MMTLSFIRQLAILDSISGSDKTEIKKYLILKRKVMISKKESYNDCKKELNEGTKLAKQMGCFD